MDNRWVKVPRDNGVHILPMDDLYQHDMTCECPCCPIHHTDDNIVEHFAWDAREEYDRGRKPH